MPSSNERGGAGSPRSQRYRPAAQFDDATLAQKREYWRTKKREQRAKLSERRGKPKVSNREVSNSLNSNPSRTIAAAGPPLLNSDGSYQTEVTNAPGIPFWGKGEAERMDTACQNQKERWFQRIKLNKVLPQFPGSNPGPNNQLGAAVNRPVMSAKSNGALLNHASSMPQVRVTTPPSVSAPHQLQGGTRTANGSSSGWSTQQNLATHGASGPNALNKHPTTVRIQPRLLKANVTTGTNMGTSHFASVLINKPVEQGANATQLAGKKIILGAAYGNKVTSEKTHTEEERAAKRREQWRIKKREQRAKQAAKVATAREKTQNMVSQKARQFVKVVLERPSSVLNREGQWQCFGRARTPLTTAGRLLKNAKAVAASNAIPRHASIMIKKEASDSPSSTAKIPTTSNNVNQQSVQVKVENSSEAPANAGTAANATTGHNRAGGDPSRRFHVNFSHINRGLVRSRTPRQRFMEIQRTFLGQRNIRARSPSLFTAFLPSRPPREDPFETPEQKAARRREYWRVKKREQRAKLTVEVKAKMKEKDALMRRVKRYQSILQDMRKARAAGCYSLSQPIGSSHTSASETIGGFIKEDGTVTIPHIALETSEKPQGGESQNASRNAVLGSQTQTHPPPPPLRPAQVKVSYSPIGLSVTKPPRLLSIRPRTDLQTPLKNPTSTHTFVIQPTTQITLSHPQNVLNAFPTVSLMGAKPASCVMQMAVTSSRPIAAPANQGPELSEEERMAKKREYWRVKKREQRAARAARLKQGQGQGRASIMLQRRRNQRPKPVRRIAVTNTKLNIQPPANTSSSSPAKKTALKQEIISANDPDLQSKQTDSVDVKPLLSSLLPTQEAQPESDPALSADSQATTLLAVASMKKLLEESLSNVTEESKSQQTDDVTKLRPCKTEPQTYITEDGSELEMKPRIPLLSLGDEEEEDKGSIAGDLARNDKQWQGNPVTPPSCQANTSPPNSDVKLSPSSRDPPPLNSSCTATPSLQIPPHTLPSNEGSCTPTTSSSVPQPLFPRRAQRLRDKKAGQHHCCSPGPSEPPKLHHPPLLQQQQQQQHTSKQEPGSKPQSPAPEQSSSLQNKREYWRLMKRQQRARSKARQREGFKQGDYSRRLALKAAQTPNTLIIKNSKPVQKVLQAPLTLRANTSPILQPISAPVSGAHASLTAVTNIPTLLVVSPTVANAGQPPDTLLVKPPIVSSPPQQVHVKIGTLQASPTLSPVSLPVSSGVAVSPLGERKEGMLILVENKQEAVQGSNPDSPHVRKWSLQVQDVANPDIPTLTPPANPLASIKLLPIEPRPSFKLAVTSTPGQVKSPGVLNPSSGKTHNPAPSWLPINTLGPPKPVPGESEEETLRRKREYWRVKKKEQRAKKAMRDRDLSQKRASSNWKPLLPAQDQLDTQEQYSSQWVNTSEESDFILSTSTETDLDYFNNLDHIAPIEDETDVLFPDAEDNMDDCEVSEGVWRHRYLMDHDPLNQLLVCMVCGDLQYSHSVEGVRAHIEEAHPETLGLGVPERRRILEAWDEQVSRRERFFTSQLQQHGAPLEEDSANLPAEMEVMADPDANTKATKRL